LNNPEEENWLCLERALNIDIAIQINLIHH
jgi:hypothetical protein